MSQAKILYALGCIILFLGLLWMFLPHAYHSSILQEDETSHLFHTFEGAIGALLGLIILIASSRHMKKENKTKL
jgi:nitrate reductase gamma subunit